MKMYQVERFSIGAYALALVLLGAVGYNSALGEDARVHRYAAVCKDPTYFIDGEVPYQPKRKKSTGLARKAIINSAYQALHQEHLDREQQAESYIDQMALLREAFHYDQVGDKIRCEKFAFLSMLVDPNQFKNDAVTATAINYTGEPTASSVVKSRALERIKKDGERNQPQALLFLGLYHNGQGQRGLARFYFAQAQRYAGTTETYAEVASLAQQELAKFIQPNK